MGIVKIHYDGKLNIDIAYEMSLEHFEAPVNKTSKEQTKENLQDIIDKHMERLQRELLEGATAGDSVTVSAVGKRFTMKYEENANGNTADETEQ